LKMPTLRPPRPFWVPWCSRPWLVELRSLRSYFCDVTFAKFIRCVIINYPSIPSCRIHSPISTTSNSPVLYLSFSSREAIYRSPPKDPSRFPLDGYHGSPKSSRPTRSKSFTTMASTLTVFCASSGSCFISLLLSPSSLGLSSCQSMLPTQAATRLVSIDSRMATLVSLHKFDSPRPWY
jgi:hypothetical protein